MRCSRLWGWQRSQAISLLTTKWCYKTSMSRNLTSTTHLTSYAFRYILPMLTVLTKLLTAIENVEFGWHLADCMSHHCQRKPRGMLTLLSLAPVRRLSQGL